MKQRLLLCLLLCGVLLYYAVPRLSLTGGVESVFAVSWLLLALFASAGNLAGLLYSPKRKRKRSEQKEYKKMRDYS